MYGIILFREISLPHGRSRRKHLAFLSMYTVALIVELIVLVLKLWTQRRRSHTYAPPSNINSSNFVLKIPEMKN